MSEEMPAGLFFFEKVIGLILIIIGAVVAYITAANPPTGDISNFTSFFILGGIILIGIGIFLIIAKTE